MTSIWYKLLNVTKTITDPSFYFLRCKTLYEQHLETFFAAAHSTLPSKRYSEGQMQHVIENMKTKPIFCIDLISKIYILLSMYIQSSNVTKI